MAYRFNRTGPLAKDVRRVVDKQLIRAVEQLHGATGHRAERAIHEARRRVKKVRALLRLVKQPLGHGYRAANTRMRAVNRMLAPVADALAATDTLAALKRHEPAGLPRDTERSIRAALVDYRAQIERRAESDRVLPKAVDLLRRQREDRLGQQLNRHGFRAIAGGLEQSLRRARRAMTRALRTPSADNYHTWRKRVKDLWLQVRLLEPRCGNQLAYWQRRLELLDGYLGEYHNLVLLERLLTTTTVVPPRLATRCLKPLRHYQARLRDRASALGRAVCGEPPHRVVKQIERLWKKSSARKQAMRGSRAVWPLAA